MFRIMQVRKTERLQSGQYRLNAYRKGGLMQGKTADDIDNTIFFRWTDIPSLFRTIDNPKKVNIVFRLQVKVEFLIYWYHIRNHVNRSNHTIIHKETFAVKMYFTAAFSLDPLYPFHTLAHFHSLYQC